MHKTDQHKFKSRIVNIGEISLGGEYPIRLQSMTNTKTLNTKATVAQAIRIYEAGGDFIRITTPGIKEAENLKNIKAELKRQGYNFPLIADIHYNPLAAEIAAKIIEKIRINPGNYIDKKTVGKIEFTPAEYAHEIDKIRNRISPLIKICKEYGTAIRIGSNHGSLSDRILGRYGDTPEGMVESAMEFLRICAELDFHNIVVSMKASNTRIMVQATRLLAKKMMDESMNYPLHLGVTEAGEGEDGRIKSAAGIGSLLEDGLGDTIRVSLTEAPENEIPVAKTLLEYFKPAREKNSIFLFSQNTFNPFQYTKRQTTAVHKIGSSYVPIVIADFSESQKNNFSEYKSDYFLTDKRKIEYQKFPEQNFIVSPELFSKKQNNIFPIFQWQDYSKSNSKSDKINFQKITSNDLNTDFLKSLKNDPTAMLILENDSLENQRKFFISLKKINCATPVIVSQKYKESRIENLQIKSAAHFGTLLNDGFCDGILLSNQGKLSIETLESISFGILQATHARISKTEFISCPTCGRTQYDIEKVLSEIRLAASHLKGLKIAVMGCIVNGPGEMADADYGYVGSAAGKVNLYKGKDLIKKNIPSEKALTELLIMIKENGDWIDK